MLQRELKDIDQSLSGAPVDLFVCCASFEERSVSIASNMLSTRIRKAVIFVNRDYFEVARHNLERLKGIFSEVGRSYKLDTSDPVFTADQMVKALSGVLGKGGTRRIVVDITSFTRESMLMLLRYLYSHKSAENSVEFVYANASEYSVGDSVERKWLSRGHREVRSVLGYSGVLIPSKQTHLIVLVGFEDERALTLVQVCEPAKITLGIADEAEWATVPHQDTNLHRLTSLKNMVGEVEDFTFSGYDALKTKETVQSIVKRNKQYNTMIAPMNTKISTIGVGMAALEDDTVQVCYSQANIYNVEGYSTPGEYFFHLSMDEVAGRS